MNWYIVVAVGAINWIGVIMGLATLVETSIRKCKVVLRIAALLPSILLIVNLFNYHFGASFVRYRVTGYNTLLTLGCIALLVYFFVKYGRTDSQ